MLKSELAGKLAEKHPQRAAAEIREVERISREALSEVRAAVQGYRGSGLAAELARAKVAVAPGIGFGEHGDGHVRIALVENTHRLRQAVRNVRAFLQAESNLAPVTAQGAPLGTRGVPGIADPVSA